MAFLRLLDKRANCISVITHISVRDYIRLVDTVYKQKGGIKNQRPKLTTTSARRIRARMRDDIKLGAIFPPIVIGWIVPEDEFERIQNDEKFGDKIVDAVEVDDLSIIDGMQRTTAILEALEEAPAIADNLLRVEFWIAAHQDALVYRMLVLNAGQIPWDIKKQIAVIFEPLIEKTKRETGVERVIGVGGGRRFNAGEYNANDIAEMYISFGSRKLSIDTQEVLADEFSRLDIVSTISEQQDESFFYRAIDMLIALDTTFSEYKRPDDQKTQTGRKIFDKQTARIGFICAVAVDVLGRAGSDRDFVDKKTRMVAVEAACKDFCERLRSMSQQRLGEFIQYDILEEQLQKRSGGQVGRYERSLFFEGFKVLLEQDFNVSSLEVCWRAAL